MEEGLPTEVIVLVRVRRTDDCDHISLVIEHRSIHRPITVVINLLSLYEISLILMTYVMEGILIYPASENHLLEDLRGS